MKAHGLKLFLLFSFFFFTFCRQLCLVHVNSLITHLQLKKMWVIASLRILAALTNNPDPNAPFCSISSGFMGIKPSKGSNGQAHCKITGYGNLRQIEIG